METLEVAGHWWIPGDESHKVPGILKFSLSRAGELTLIGGLRRPEDLATPELMPDGSTRTSVTQEMIDEAGNYGRLHGICNGRAFTLEGCFQRRSRGGFPGRTYEEIVYVNNVYDGIWFATGETAEGNAVGFTVDGLTEWVARSGITRLHRGSPEQDEPNVELHGKTLPKEVGVLLNDGTVTLHHRLSASSPGPAASLAEEYSFDISYDSKVPVVDLLDAASDLQDLVSIATDRTAQFGTVRVVHPDTADQEGKRQTTLFTVWSAWTALRREDQKPLNAWRDLLFSLDDIGGMMGLTAWMNVAEKYRSPLGRAMATKYAQKTYVSDRFMNRVAALEGFDRILTSTSQGPTFAQRISRCIDLAGPQFAQLVHDPRKWATELKHHRNEVAHHYGRRMRQATHEQVDIADGAYWLLAFCLLREASVQDTVFDKILQHAKLQYLSRRNRVMFS